jgi:hypothetical protein
MTSATPHFNAASTSPVINERQKTIISKSIGVTMPSMISLNLICRFAMFDLHKITSLQSALFDDSLLLCKNQLFPSQIAHNHLSFPFLPIHSRAASLPFPVSFLPSQAQANYGVKQFVFSLSIPSNNISTIILHTHSNCRLQDIHYAHYYVHCIG